MTPLVELSPGTTGVVRTLQGGQGFVSRLVALGFTPGAAVTMVRNYGLGPIIVALRGTQVALGRQEAKKVLVHSAEGRDDTLFNQ